MLNAQGQGKKNTPAIIFSAHPRGEGKAQPRQEGVPRVTLHIFFPRDFWRFLNMKYNSWSFRQTRIFQDWSSLSCLVQMSTCTSSAMACVRRKQNSTRVFPRDSISSRCKDWWCVEVHADYLRDGSQNNLKAHTLRKNIVLKHRGVWYFFLLQPSKIVSQNTVSTDVTTARVCQVLTQRSLVRTP